MDGDLTASAGEDWDHLFKLLLVGSSGVGKTALLFRYCENTFTDDFASTVGIDFRVKTVVRQGRKIKLQIWDTAGQERFKAITSAYYRGAMGFLLVYDITRPDSFQSVRHWFTEIQAGSGQYAQMVLIGNKVDLAQEPDRADQVSKVEGSRTAEDLGVPFYETSAKSGHNVNEALNKLVDDIVAKMIESAQTGASFPSTEGPGLGLKQPTEQQQSSCSC